MEREYDLVVFGATGVTGKFVMEEFAQYGDSITWAIAGRNQSKLLKSLAEVVTTTGADMSRVGLIEADVTNTSSIKQMCLRTKVVVNCVGPYRFYGEKVIASAVAARTHYIDVCGEPQFLEEMQLKYFPEAHANGIYIIGSCGFDSIPCDIGVQFLRQQFLRDDPATLGQLNSVESFLEINMTEHSKGNYATWLSAIHSIFHAPELKTLRMKLKEKIFPHGSIAFHFPLKPRPVLFKSEVIKKWSLPFLGSDKSVVIRSQMYGKQFENKMPVQIQTYFCVSSFLYALLFIFMGGIFSFLAKFQAGRSLLERYPGFFSCGLFTKDPPTRQQMTGGSFALTLCGSGWSKRTDENFKIPDKKMLVKVTGPDPGYVTTAICVVAVCKILLDDNERNKMAEGGGVLTPAAAFSRTSLIQKLEDRGILMTVVEEGSSKQQ